MTGRRVCHNGHIAFLAVIEDASLLTKTVKINQSPGIPGSGKPGRTFVKNSYKRSRTSLPSPLYFSSLSLLRTALHYLNAWNRLIVNLLAVIKIQTEGTAAKLSETDVTTLNVTTMKYQRKHGWTNSKKIENGTAFVNNYFFENLLA